MGSRGCDASHALDHEAGDLLGIEAPDPTDEEFVTFETERRPRRPTLLVGRLSRVGDPVGDDVDAAAIMRSLFDGRCPGRRVDDRGRGTLERQPVAQGKRAVIERRGRKVLGDDESSAQRHPRGRHRAVAGSWVRQVEVQDVPAVGGEVTQHLEQGAACLERGDCRQPLGGDSVAAQLRDHGI